MTDLVVYCAEFDIIGRMFWDGIDWQIELYTNQGANLNKRSSISIEWLLIGEV